MIFRCGIIGCGQIAGGYDQQLPSVWSATHAGAYHLCGETELVAVSDPDPKVLEAFQEKWQVKQGYLDYEEMLKDNSIDIVSLCLPTEHHLGAFRACMERDVPAVFCEKPLAYNLSDAQKMVEMSRGKVVSVNYFRRWNKTLATMVDACRQGAWGKAIMAVIRYTKGLLVNGSHLVDLIRWFWGEPLQINYIKTTGEDPIDPGVDFSLTFQGEAIAYFLHVPRVDYVFVDVDIVMEKGRVIIGQRGQQMTTYSVEREIHYGLFDILGIPHREETEWKHCIPRAVNEIVTCIKHGGRPACTVEDGFRAMEICHEVMSKMAQTEGN